MPKAIEVAFSEIGIRPLPMNRRIWQFVKDKGALNTNQVAAGLGLPANTVSSQLGQLRDRALLVSKPELDKTTGHTVHYFSAPAKLKKFELLPISSAAKERRAKARRSKNNAAEPFVLVGTAGLAQARSGAQPPTPPAIAAPTGLKTSPAAVLLDSMSVREAYALYLELRGMFNPSEP